MSKFNPKAIYKEMKENRRRNLYSEEKHCVMALKSFSTVGSVASFCREATISDSVYYRWMEKYPLFNDAVRIGKMAAQAQWEDDGLNNMYNDEFNTKIWESRGKMHFNYNKAERIRLKVKADGTPQEQYKDLIKQAAAGDFSAAEFKQIMESINIGVRVFESFEMQEEIRQMKEDLLKMQDDG